MIETFSVPSDLRLVFADSYDELAAHCGWTPQERERMLCRSSEAYLHEKTAVMAALLPGSHDRIDDGVLGWRWGVAANGLISRKVAEAYLQRVKGLARADLEFRKKLLPRLHPWAAAQSFNLAPEEAASITRDKINSGLFWTSPPSPHLGFINQLSSPFVSGTLVQESHAGTLLEAYYPDLVPLLDPSRTDRAMETLSQPGLRLFGAYRLQAANRLWSQADQRDERPLSRIPIENLLCAALAHRASITHRLTGTVQDLALSALLQFISKRQDEINLEQCSPYLLSWLVSNNAVDQTRAVFRHRATLPSTQALADFHNASEDQQRGYADTYARWVLGMSDVNNRDRIALCEHPEILLSTFESMEARSDDNHIHLLQCIIPRMMCLREFKAALPEALWEQGVDRLSKLPNIVRELAAHSIIPERWLTAIVDRNPSMLKQLPKSFCTPARLIRLESQRPDLYWDRIWKSEAAGVSSNKDAGPEIQPGI